MSADAGWFPDPREGSAGVRWWDGQQWTSWLADSVDAPAPDPDSTEDQAVPEDRAAPDEHAAPDQHAEPVAEPVAERAAAVRLPVAVAVTVAALVFALLAVGATVTATSRTVVSGPGVPPPTPTGAPAVTYESGTRTARAGGLSIVLPTAPWDCTTTAKKIAKYFSKAIACSVIVHENYNGKADSFANLVIGILDPALVESSVPQTADRVFHQVQTNLYNSPTRLSDNVSGPAQLGPSSNDWRVEGRLNYTVKGLGTRYDQVQVVVSPLGDGQYAGVLSNLVDDAPGTIRSPLDAAFTSLSSR